MESFGDLTKCTVSAWDDAEGVELQKQMQNKILKTELQPQKRERDALDIELDAGKLKKVSSVFGFGFTSSNGFIDQETTRLHLNA